MFKQMNIRILGIVENMSFFIPPDMPDRSYEIFGKDVMLEDVNAIEGMQEGRGSPAYNGGNFSPVMDQPTHQFHKWVAKSQFNHFQI